MTESFDVIVAGAGIVGLSTARRLAEQGARVALLDPDQKGGRGSRAAAGVVIPSVRLRSQQKLHEFARQGQQELQADLQQLAASYAIRRQGHGVIRLVFTEAEKEKLELSFQEAGTSAGSFFRKDELIQLEPVLEGSSLFGGFFQEHGFAVNTGDYLDALVYEASRCGVALHLGEAALAVEEGKQEVTVHTHTGPLHGKWFVLAAGAWSGTIAGLPPAPIFPLRGQMLVVRQPPFTLKHVISSRGYLVPWQSGGILIGATEEEARFHEYNTPDGLIYLLGALTRLAPSLRKAQITKMWAGLRAATRDGCPRIGYYPGMKRVILAAGHTGQGILTGALTGKAVADLVNTGKSEIAAPFAITQTDSG